MTGTDRVPQPSTVLWFLPEFPPNPGGIGTFAGAVSPVLARLGHDMHLLVGWGGPSRESTAGVEVIREPLRSAFEKASPVEVMRVRRVVSALKSEIEPTLYHVHLSDPTPVLHLATESTAPAPTVLTLHNEMASLFSAEDPESLLARLMATARVTTGVSTTVIRQAGVAVPGLAHRLIVVPNGVEIIPEPPPLPSGSRVLAIGRLLPQKGFDRLLQAWPVVLDTHPDARLDILGDGPDRDLLQAMADDLDISTSVTLRGMVEREEVPGFLARSQLVVAPSRHEGMPYALLEAAAFGRPIVASRTGGIDEVVVDGETGVLVDQTAMDEHPATLGRAISLVLADSPLARRLGSAGRARVERYFSIDACARAYDRVYRAVTAPAVDVAVIIPAWNSARHLSQAIESVLANVASVGASAQVLVVDDGSTDRTFDVASSYTGEGVEVFRQLNAGTTMARNAGLALTNSRYVAHLDADDVWPDGRLEALMHSLETDATVGAAFGRVVEFADPDAPARARWNPDPVLVRVPTAGLLRRSAHDTFGGFDVTRRNNDQLSWATSALARGLRYATIDEVVLRRRDHAGNQSHGRPFLQDRTRVAVLRASLAERRGAPT